MLWVQSVYSLIKIGTSCLHIFLSTMTTKLPKQPYQQFFLCVCLHIHKLVYAALLLIKKPVQWPIHPSVYKYICSTMICTGISACGIRCRACHLWQCYMAVHLGLIKGLWAHISNLDSVLFALILLLITQSGYNFAHVMTTKLSWHVQNYDLIWLAFFMHEQSVFKKD